jgi:hypothetical protein
MDYYLSQITNSTERIIYANDLQYILSRNDYVKHLNSELQYSLLNYLFISTVCLTVLIMFIRYLSSMYDGPPVLIFERYLNNHCLIYGDIENNNRKDIVRENIVLLTRIQDGIVRYINICLSFAPILLLLIAISFQYVIIHNNPDFYPYQYRDKLIFGANDIPLLSRLNNTDYHKTIIDTYRISYNYDVLIPNLNVSYTDYTMSIHAAYIVSMRNRLNNVLVFFRVVSKPVSMGSNICFILFDSFLQDIVSTAPSSVKEYIDVLQSKIPTNQSSYPYRETLRYNWPYNNVFTIILTLINISIILLLIMVRASINIHNKIE